MKKYVLTAILIVATIFVSWSQKVITQRLNVTGKRVVMKFDFADIINVETWNKNSVELEVKVNIDDNRYNDCYSLNTNELKEEVKLEEKVDFQRINKARGDSKNCNFNKEIVYKLKVPSSLEFSLKTIAGQVIMTGSVGKASVNSISGFIDYAVPANLKTQINLSTVTGDVYSNLKLDNKAEKEVSWVGTKRHLILNGGTLPIELKTVSGNIYLRRSKQMNCL
jgi:hypothetical protein